ncbi:hypothetical protein [Demequina subtropica]|uniref:hypothetical protein n=1 Tax=Demequina subtropica TaxID=1638989 RepID=UPI000784FE48|nr:hypothetical protein [Demequina subtropica]
MTRALRIALSALAAAAVAACSAPSAAYIDDATLEPATCSPAREGVECFDAVVAATGDAGDVVTASCAVVALDTETEPMPLTGPDKAAVAAVNADPNLGLESLEVTVGVPVTVASLALPLASDPAFLRWHLSCDPGAEG